MLSRFRDWFSFESEPDVLVAQYREVRRQVPLLHGLLIINGCAVAYSHYPFAPGWLTLGVEGVLLAISLWRLSYWTLSSDAEGVDAAQARRILIKTTLTTVPLCIAFVTWSLAIDQYGGTLEHAHIGLFIAVTVIGCIFCLVSLPQAALLVTATVTLPYLTYYIWWGNPVFIAMAFNTTLVTGVMIRALLNHFTGFTTLIRSQTNRALEQAEAERLCDMNARLALTDTLTCLPNRRHFFSQLDDLLAKAQSGGQRFAVGVLDLDRFKPVNDTYGHVVGDRMLVDIGRRLASVSTATMTISRLGGDEFGILISDNVDLACAMAQGICDLLSEPFDIDGQGVSLGCSGGIATYPEGGRTAEELFDRSDYALYQVKSVQPGRCALYSAEHENRIRTQRAIESALQTADLESELHVEFQPILCTETMAVLGVEALGRWTSPTVGAVRPDIFITAAERLGCIHAITLKLFEKALFSLELMPPSIYLSFNLSAHDIVSPETVRQIVGVLGQSDIHASRVTFELTETALMRDFDAAVAGIRALRALGSRIALDDFGMGYSSLSYLHKLPLDKVKVDRSFIADMDEVSGRKIISAILGLCTTMDLDCIIEGVETEAQLQQLRALGYRMAQGYLLARPMPIAALLGWLGRQAIGSGSHLTIPRLQKRIEGGYRQSSAA